jgi:hypothetical protein
VRQQPIQRHVKTDHSNCNCDCGCCPASIVRVLCLFPPSGARQKTVQLS